MKSEIDTSYSDYVLTTKANARLLFINLQVLPGSLYRANRQPALAFRPSLSRLDLRAFSISRTTSSAGLPLNLYTAATPPFTFLNLISVLSGAGQESCKSAAAHLRHVLKVKNHLTTWLQNFIVSGLMPITEVPVKTNSGFQETLFRLIKLEIRAEELPQHGDVKEVPTYGVVLRNRVPELHALIVSHPIDPTIIE
ncbi:Holliday junction ATP-dependent DNA helicaseRuvB [Striga asiatica]|uniref:Holliday junction ATP-dependent DNA helicaseRuvB n=1 Tax=Striga asiatica TaxID=4170 RepID=A0A5A7P305_STRAF|nr:Holliday junction ATP-dependent DNA helicaseRuvB [Striga asiatica]